MNKNILGATGIEVSELSFGTLTLSRIQADLTPDQGVPTLRKALELGINFFDTAESYATQDHLRVGLGSAMDEVIISTKTHAKDRSEARKAFDQSLQELSREYLDVYQMHLVSSAEDLESRREVLDFMLELKKQERIRAIGASVHTVGAAKAIAMTPEIDVLFPVFNAEGLGIIDGSVKDMIEACNLAKANGKGLFAMKPLAGGHLRAFPKKAIEFVRETGLMDSICIGMKSPAEVEMNVRLFEGRDTPQDILDQVENVPRTLRIYPRCIGCGACVETCDQGALHIDESQKDESLGKKGQSVVDASKCILCGYCANVCPEFTIRVI